ncbi:MAG: ATP-dependent sacrificial sulfur transferase LarE [Candidatus Aminicenantes bacterium]|nr:ATP-dependent sacrificial sulfur transferase LarE [Candidatus Aminicenantes bacterium]
MAEPTTAAKFKRLRAILEEIGRVVVGFSGGVDSTFLLKTAADTLGRANVLAVVAGSETYPSREVREARRLARKLKIRHRFIETHELDDPRFSKNPPLRCYYCKGELWSEMGKIARTEGFSQIVDGANADDTRDFRPGAKAGREKGVRSPLQEAGLTKDEIRRLSKRAGLPTWNKPSLACLASRFPYGTPIERRSLSQVGRAEDFLRGLGIGQLRVRHHKSIARVEVSPADFSKLVRPAVRSEVVARLKKLGYTYVALDLDGYRTGSMNEGLNRRAAKR